MPHWVKWVRYFLDYEAKYGVGVPRGRLIDGFLEKLASKGQSVGLRDQACRAIKVFMEMGAGEYRTAMESDRGFAVAEPLGMSTASGARSTTSVPLESDHRRGWQEVETALMGEIKRRNYSPKTMKTYLT